jgi:type II secretory pathway pseudopilin PulG
MKSASGFTLVEVLVTGLLASILAGAIISALYMTNSQTKEGIGTEKAIQISAVVSEEIRRKVRNATSLVQIDPLANMGVFLKNSVGDTIGGFQRVQFILQEYKPISKWEDMQIGATPVQVFPDPTLSNFIVSPSGTALSFRLRYQISDYGQTFYFPAIPDQVQCRGNL